MAKEHPQFWYTLVDGIIISEYPSDRIGDDPCRLQATLERGCTAFLDLTEPDEQWEAGNCPLHPYESLLRDLAAQRGLDVVYERHPVCDLSIPTIAQMQRILDTIDAWHAKRHQVLIHCLGGIGRSGTVAACYLVQHGWTSDQALRHIQQHVQASPKRGRKSPETQAQIEFVHTWATWATCTQKSMQQGATEKRIATTQAWVRRYAPLREQPLLVAEVAEVAHWSDEELAEWRKGLMEDFLTTMQGRSDLFPNLLSFEAWYRMTGYVLGQPMDEQVAKDTAWLWNYSVDSYAPYNPWMVEELAILIVSHHEGYLKVFRDWQQRSKVVCEIGAPARPTEDAPAYWQHIGISPLFGKLANDQSDIRGGPTFWENVRG